MKNKYNSWIYRSLDVGLAVNGNEDSEVVIQDTESGEQSNLVFSKTDTKEEMIQRIGEEVYGWLLLMMDQMEDESFDEE